MTTPAYRATVYERRSDQSNATTEPDILTATSPHTDTFKVATITGVSGFQPYLAIPTGARGAIDLKTKRWTRGTLQLRLLDVEVSATDRLQRWVTAFLGDSVGRVRLLGCKVFVEESTDGGTTWTPFWVGRVEEASLEDPLWYVLQLDDMSSDLNVDCFGERPHSSITYASEAQLLPLGLSSAYGSIPVATTLGGTVGAADVSRGATTRKVTLDTASRAATDNIISLALVRLLYPLLHQAQDPIGGSLGQLLDGGLGTLRQRPAVRLRFSCASPSVTNKEVEVQSVQLQQRDSGTFRLLSLIVRPLTKADGSLSTGDPYYQAFDTGTIADSTALTSLSLRLDYTRARGTLPAEGATDEAPLLIGDVHVLDFFRDVCDGDFSRLYRDGETLPTGTAAGDAMYPVSLDTTATTSPWDILRNPSTSRNAFPTMRARITKRMKRFDVLEQLGQQFGFGYRLQPAASAVARIVPVDLRLPTAALIASIDTLTEADLDTATAPSWSTDRSSAITETTVRWYTDYQLSLAELTADAGIRYRFPDVPPARIETVSNDRTIPDYGRAVDLGQRVHTLDAWAIRATAYGADTVENVSATTYAEALADHAARHLATFYQNGAMMLGFRALRTANTTDLWPGDWVYVNADIVPDPATNLRGGTRLLLILKRSEAGVYIDFEGIDAGAGASASVPTVGSPSQRTSDTYHGVSVTVTVNASTEPVELQFAVKATSYGTTAPADNDTGWLYATTAVATGSVDIQNLPSNSRVFVRARSLPDPKATNGTPKLPSAWVLPSGTKYVDTAALTAPSAVSVLPSPILTTSTVTGSWTNADTIRPVEVILTTGGNDRLIAVLVAGSVGPVTLNSYLASSTTYTLSARLRDGLGGYSAKGTSASFTTPASFTGPTLSAPTLTVVVG